MLWIESAGGILGAVAIVDGGRFHSTTIADIPSEILQFERYELHHFCREYTEFVWALAKMVAHQARRYADIIESLALRSVEQRLAEYICSMLPNRGVATSEGYQFELPLTQVDIASRIGSVREVVSRAFAQLRTAGLIQMEGHKLVTVPSVRALRSYAGLSTDVPSSAIH